MSEEPAQSDELRDPSEGETEAHPRRMLDRYEVLAEIARGGMGTVLLARLEGAGGFERLMAIKLMHEHLVEDESFVTMLLDEARTAANIEHPNAVGIVDIAESPVGYYLVMSYVEGFTLAQLLKHPKLSERDRIRFGLRLLVDACHGLHAAHITKDARGKALNIVHRDVSPQNVLVGLDGVGRIVDFGIALAASRVTSSRPGMLKGKPSYMAPEQVRGEPCDARADVFTLGIIAWEIVCGSRLFRAAVDIATLLKVIELEIPPPGPIQPLLTEALEAAVMRALSRDLDERTPDARTLAVELEEAATQADLFANTPEVADAIGSLFAEEIESKQEAIRHHLLASAGEAKPLMPGQMHLIPKLSQRVAAPRSHDIQAEESNSGMREKTVDGMLSIETTAIATDAPGPEEVDPPTGEVAEGGKAASPMPWVAVIIGAVLLGGIAYLASTWDTEPGTETEPASEPAAASEPASAPEPAPEPASAPEPAPEPEPVSEPAPEPAPPRPVLRPRPRPRPAPQEGTTIENNPYLTR